MNDKRAFHSLSLLPDGTALAAGAFIRSVGTPIYRAAKPMIPTPTSGPWKET